MTTKKKQNLPDVNNLKIEAKYKNLDLTKEVSDLLSVEQKKTLSELAHKKLNPDYSSIALEIYNQFLCVLDYLSVPSSKLDFDFTTKVRVPEGLVPNNVITKINRLLKDNKYNIKCIINYGDGYNTHDYFIFSTNIKFYENF